MQTYSFFVKYQNNLCEITKEIIVPASEINEIEKSLIKTNTDKEYEQLF